MNRSRIIATLTLAIFVAPMSAAAQDAAFPPHTTIVGAWQGTVDGDELEIAIWYETENKFRGPILPTRTTGNFIAYASLKNGGCGEYLHGHVLDQNAFGYDIAVERRGLSFSNRGETSHLFADCEVLTSFGLVVSVDSPDTIELRGWTPSVGNSTLRRISASKALLEKAADGPPENPAKFVANSKPSAEELAIMRDAGAGANGAVAKLAAEMIPTPPTPIPYRETAIALERSSLSNVGNWIGEYQGQEIELSVWFDDHPLQQGHVRGYIVNRDNRCVTGLIGNRVMGQGSRFFGFMNDKSLTDYGFEFVAQTIAMDDLDTTCGPLKFPSADTRLMLVYEPDLGHASLATYGDQHLDAIGYSHVVRVASLRRVAASATMQKIVAANPPIKKEIGAKNRPSPSVQQLLENPDLDPVSFIPVDEIPCRVLLRDQAARVSLLGLRDIASTREPNNKLGIRYQQASGPFLGRPWSEEFEASQQERYLQVDASSFSDPTFLNLPDDRNSWPFGEDACAQARMVDQFVTSLGQGLIESVDATLAVGNATPRIDDASSFFFFDVAGIDRIANGSMERVYGTTTLFVPGDMSREGLWSPGSQTMKLRAMVKHSGSAHIGFDSLSKHNVVSFVHDAELSKGAGSDVWVSVADYREGGLCIRWSEKYVINRCAERSTNDLHSKHRYYMTADLAAAKKIFHSISPDAIALSRGDPAGSTRGCERGAFCKLPGGAYLNAIHDGDFGIIQRLDAHIRRTSLDAVDEVMPGDESTYQMLSNFVPTSLLPYLAKRYMYKYQSASQECFEPGHKVVTKELIIAGGRSADMDYNGYIIMGQDIPDGRMATSYDINPEFFTLCDSVCDPLGPTGNTKLRLGFMTAKTLLTDEGRTMNEGLDKVLFEHDCASPAVQQFERNLITLTEQAMNAGARPFVERSSL